MRPLFFVPARLCASPYVVNDMLDIKWTIEVHVPQLDFWGEKLMAELSGIHAAIVELTNQQAAGSDAIATQLTTIADEIAQLNTAAISQDDLDAIEQQIRAAAQLAADQAAQIRANSQQIAGMVPDEPPAA